MELLQNSRSGEEFPGGNRKVWETANFVNRKRAVDFFARLTAAVALFGLTACVQQLPPAVSGGDPVAQQAPAPPPPPVVAEVPPTAPAQRPELESPPQDPSDPALSMDEVRAAARETERQTPELGEQDEVPDEDPSALEDFRGELEPYGSWLEHPVYGTVWVPHRSAVGTQFAPYVTRGHWALTHDEQWLWVSDYPFGGVVFHYGRWVWTDRAGWVWIPGRRYAHAWVQFRVSDSPYVGWSPMPPRYVWRSGRAVWLSSVPPSPYIFVHAHHAFYPALHRNVILEHYRVRNLAARSRLYVPRSGRGPLGYYSPPLRHIPAKARPARRLDPDARATSLRRFASGAPRQTQTAQRPKVQTLRSRPQADRSDQTLRTRRVVKKEGARQASKLKLPKPERKLRPAAAAPPARTWPSRPKGSDRSGVSGRMRAVPRRSR